MLLRAERAVAYTPFVILRTRYVAAVHVIGDIRTASARDGSRTWVAALVGGAIVAYVCTLLSKHIGHDHGSRQHKTDGAASIR